MSSHAVDSSSISPIELSPKQHTQKAPIIEIDPSGDMYIQTFEYANKRVHTATLIQVSSSILCQNSDFFKSHLEEFGKDDPLGLHHISLSALELWLRIIHNCINEDHIPDLSISDFERAIRVGQEYEFNFSKLNVWFAIWLGSQNIVSFEVDDLRRLLSLASDLNHGYACEVLNVLLTEVESGVEDPTIATAFKLFPPVPIMSTRQNSTLLFLLEDVPTAEYERWGFSPAFRAIYGEPLEYYSDFHRLMTTAFDHSVVPQIKRLASLADQDTKPRFLWFCEMADEIARKEGLPMLKRREMEAAWVWVAFELYDRDEMAEPALLKKIVAKVSLCVEL